MGDAVPAEQSDHEGAHRSQRLRGMARAHRAGIFAERHVACQASAAEVWAGRLVRKTRTCWRTGRVG
jgi:hypothetical protein